MSEALNSPKSRKYFGQKSMRTESLANVGSVSTITKALARRDSAPSVLDDESKMNVFLTMTPGKESHIELKEIIADPSIAKLN